MKWKLAKWRGTTQLHSTRLLLYLKFCNINLHVFVPCSAKKGLVVTEVSAIRETLNEICSDEVIDRFAEVWEDIGLEEAHRKDRRETIRKHLIEMLTEMLNEELALKQKLHDSVHTCAAEVQKLAGELGKTATIVSTPHTTYNFNSRRLLKTCIMCDSVHMGPINM